MIDEAAYGQYFSYLLAGNRAGCAAIVKGLLDGGCDIKELYTHLFQRSLYKVGELWEYNRISVAMEHLATAVTESLLHMAYPVIFSAEHTGEKAIISCVANEYHQIGGKMVADIFELNGWDGYFLGANTPVSDLLALIDEKKPRIVCLSLAIYFNINTLLDGIEQIQASYPGLEILAGGQAFRWGNTRVLEKYRNVTYIESVYLLEEIIRS